MVNLSNLTKLTGKIDVAGMVKNVKSMVNPDHAAINSEAANLPIVGDPLSQKMTEITHTMQNLLTAATEHSAALMKLNKDLIVLNKEIEVLKKTNT